MFQKIINSLKSLNREELSTLGSSVGIVFLGFLIYMTWQYRLPDDSQPEPKEIQEESVKKEKNNIEVDDLQNQTHGYIIKDLKKEITLKEEGKILGLKEDSEFAIEYKDITHAVFNNKENLSIDDWVERKIKEKGLSDASFEEQKEFLDILIIRKKETKLGPAREIIRINGTQVEEFYISWDKYVLGFYYESENSDDLLAKKQARNELIEKIEEK